MVKLNAVIPHAQTIIKEHRLRERVGKSLFRLNCKVAKTFSSKKMTFISTREFMKDIETLSRIIPKDYDVIYCIPRTGFIVGAFLSERWDIPLSIPELLSKGKCWLSRPKSSTDKLSDCQFKRVLLVDDSVGLNRSMTEAKTLIRKTMKDVEITTAAVWVSFKAKNIDYYVHAIHGTDIILGWLLPSSRYGIWNIATDIDGVLCENPSASIVEDKDVYVEWMKKAKPLFTPKYTIHAIISNRREPYRDETERLLRKNGIQYNTLYLTPESEDALFFKTHSLKRVNPHFYIESEQESARLIHSITGIPTLCYSTMKMFS